MKRAILLLAAALVAGCTAPGTRQADRYFILGMTQDSATSPRPATGVSVAPVSASAFYDTQDMVFSRSPGIRAYYQFNHWTERPQRTIQAQLAARIEADARVRPLVLRAHLDEIYHDAAASPGTARIELTAELVDPATRAVIARRIVGCGGRSPRLWPGARHAARQSGRLDRHPSASHARAESEPVNRAAPRMTWRAPDPTPAAIIVNFLFSRLIFHATEKPSRLLNSATPTVRTRQFKVSPPTRFRE